MDGTDVAQHTDTANPSKFVAKRYMDDVIALYAMSDTWDHDEFKRSLQTQCYMPPLKLEKGSDNTFLETTFTHYR